MERTPEGVAAGAPSPRLLAVGCALPGPPRRQEEILALLGDPRGPAPGFFRDGHIATRHLHLPRPGADGRLPREEQGDLLDRHLDGALDLGARAAEQALGTAGIPASAIGHVVAVTSTGFLTPGLSARLLPALGVPREVQRHDLVGMGCNAGLNGAQVAAWSAAARPGLAVLLLCVEVCSAAYAVDGSVSNAVVNSLFGDGAAAAIVRAGEVDAVTGAPAWVDFESEVVPEGMMAMRYDWDREGARFSFFLDRDVPYVVGAHVEAPVHRLLARHGLRPRHVAHWIVHSGGRKVVDAVKYNLGLTDHDVRHTHSVLRDCGNLSSASFLFSYRRLVAEGTARPGDLGVVITMGPGVTIETALLRWPEAT